MTAKKKKAKLRVGDLRKEIARRIDLALGYARATPSCEDESIHDVRRTCKRIRAYLALFAEHDKAVSKRASRLVRDAARELSPFRDQQIIPAAIERVGERLQAYAGNDLAATMHLLAVPPRVNDPDQATECRPLAKTLSKVDKKLQKARALVKSAGGFDKRRLDATVLRPSYASGRKLVAVARQSDAPEAFHSLRKAVKLHYYQCQFVASWNKATLKTRAKAVRDLGELLGSAQDIAVLREAIDGATGLDGPAKRQCQQACKKVAEELHADSISLACELYFDSTEDFVGSLQ